MWLCIQWCKHWLKWMTCKHILSTEKFELCKSKMTPLTGWLEKESKWLCRWNKRYVKLFVVTSAGTASNVDDIRKSMSQSRWGWCSLFLDKIQHLCTGKLCCSQLDGDVLSYNHGNYLSCISWGTEKTVCHIGSLWSDHSNKLEFIRPPLRPMANCEASLQTQEIMRCLGQQSRRAPSLFEVALSHHRGYSINHDFI